MNSQSLPKWVDQKQSRGSYTFTRDEAHAATSLSAAALQRALHRLRRNGRIARIRGGFFVIVPLEYAVAGGPPASWFVDPLMTALGRPYYVGLLTAAGLHGASHQQPQEFQVMTTGPLRPVHAGRTRLVFFANRDLNRGPTIRLKTPTGSMIVSTPEMTALDLLRYPRSGGSLDNVATVLRDLIPVLKPRELARIARRFGDPPELRRLGYLLDAAGGRALTGPLNDAARSRSAKPVLLRPNRPPSHVAPDRRWRVIANESIEVEG